MPNEPVDVLIIGAGASGAAIAWSLTDTRMKIVCLEQGDWMKTADYPGVRDDWELANIRDFSPSPNVSRRSAEGVPAAAYPPRHARRDARARLQRARLALVAVGQRDREPGLRRPRRLHQRRHVPSRLPARRQGQYRRHLLAARHPS